MLSYSFADGKNDGKENVRWALYHIEKEFGVSPMLSAEEWQNGAHKLAMLSYLSQLHQALTTDNEDEKRKCE